MMTSIARYKSFKDFEKRVMVCTDIFGRGIDIERVNIVINYDMPDSADTYLHRVSFFCFFIKKKVSLLKKKKGWSCWSFRYERSCDHVLLIERGYGHLEQGAAAVRSQYHRDAREH